MNFRMPVFIIVITLLSTPILAQNTKPTIASVTWIPAAIESFKIVNEDPAKPRFKVFITPNDYNLKMGTWKFKILDMVNSRNSGYAVLKINSNAAITLNQQLRNIKIKQIINGANPKEVLAIINFPGGNNQIFKLMPAQPAPKLVAKVKKIDNVKIEAVDKNTENDNNVDNDETSTNKMYTSVQTPSTFPGGTDAWAKFLTRTLNRDLPVENGAPAGIYKVVVSFIVARDGSISDVKAENDPGYGTAAEAVRVINIGPRWTPAEQNGKKVMYRHRQIIAFQVTED